MQLASRFAHRSPVLRSNHPLSDDQIRDVAPAIFADTPHESRSELCCYIPTATVLTELRKEGFQPFVMCQTRVRHVGRRDCTKHMLRLPERPWFSSTTNLEKSLPITESQILCPRRFDDTHADLWSTFNRVQENVVKGGLTGRSASARQQRT